MPDNTQGTTTSPFNSSSMSVEEEEDDDGGGSDIGSSHAAHADDVTSGQAYCLYVSHSLSMWNSRMYEFAVVSIKIIRVEYAKILTSLKILFIQAAFPGNLTASSVK